MDKIEETRNDEAGSGATDARTIPITVLRPPPSQAGWYTETLEQWGGLPEVLPLPDAARFFAHKCQQNPAAILRVLESAVQDNSIRFWGLSSNGQWIESMIRVLHRFADKPRLNQDSGQFKVRLAPNGKLHSEAMGVNPSDVVALLVKRGRKIPEELKHLLPSVAVDADGAGTSVLQETTKQRRARWLKDLEQEQTIDESGALTRVYKRELKHNPKADRSYIGKQIKKATQERAAMPIKAVAPHKPTANSPFGAVPRTRYVDGKPVS